MQVNLARNPQDQPCLGSDCSLCCQPLLLIMSTHQNPAFLPAIYSCQSHLLLYHSNSGHDMCAWEGTDEAL